MGRYGVLPVLLVLTGNGALRDLLSLLISDAFLSGREGWYAWYLISLSDFLLSGLPRDCFVFGGSYCLTVTKIRGAETVFLQGENIDSSVMQLI